VQTTLTLRVTSLDFDTQSCELHVSGQVCEENAYVKMGSFHTLDLELNRQFTISKADGWDSVAVEMLKEAIDTASRAQIYAVLLAEGSASIWYITDYRSVWVQNVNGSLPSKRAGSTNFDKAMGKFNAVLLDTLMRQLNMPPATNNNFDAKPLLIASPGFAAQNFIDHMKTVASTTPHRPLLSQLALTVRAHSSSNSAAALAEILASPEVKTKLSDTKFARETSLLDKFYESLRRDDGRAWYGPKEVEACIEKGAVGRGGGVLLISNRLFRAQDVAERKKWVALVDKVREKEGGEVRVLSEVHESGKRLEALGGLAAILTFPIYDFDDDDEEEEEEEEDETVAENGNG
jgi:protein pelota